MADFGLIGFPLSHSFSKQYFTHKFEQEQLPYVYELFPISHIQDFQQLVQKEPVLRGLNVTLPYKQKILTYLSCLTPEAEAVGAVNTLKKLPNGTWQGHNTDVLGFVKAIQEVSPKTHFERAIVIGNGGASKAVQYALSQTFSCANIVVACRHPQQSHELFIEELAEYMLAAADIVVQTTPVGMYPNLNEMLMLPYYAMHNQQIVIDLVYNPEETLFMRYAKAQGCVLASGLTMLYAQAEAAYTYWQH